MGIIIRFPPPAMDSFEAENHEFKLGKPVAPFR